MKKICKNIWLAAACMFMLTACSQKSNKTVIDNEPTTITWIEDKPGGNVQPISLYPDVPDSLWNALGLQDGVPSSMSCFLLKTEGKVILLDAGLGAPLSQLFPKLKELGVAPEELHLIYITHLHPDHIGGLHIPQPPPFRLRSQATQLRVNKPKPLFLYVSVQS